MKSILSLLFAVAFCNAVSSQTMLDEYADSAYVSPSPACLSCVGSVWQDPMYAASSSSIDNARVFLTANGQCFQDVCYYSRELRFCNFGFNIPADASVDSLWIVFYTAASVNQAVADSNIQLMKSHTPVGSNMARSNKWQMSQAILYPTITDTIWTVADVNDPGFGLMMQVKNTSNDTVTALARWARISVHYSTPTGIFSQTADARSFSVYPNPAANAFTVDIDQPFNISEIRLSDLTGNVVHQQATKGQSKISIAGLASGTYLLSVIDKDNYTTSKRVIVLP